MQKISLAILSGLLLTSSFPKAGADWLAWFSLVPLLTAIENLSLKQSFRLGFLAGLVHYLTLIYWLVHTMKTYGGLPFYVCFPILFLFSVYLGLYIAIFSSAVTICCKKPVQYFFMIPVLWVSLEYIRSFLLSGFPWELLGYSQFRRLNLIQISDICGVYGVSFLIALANSSIFLIVLYIKGSKWQEIKKSGLITEKLLIIFILIFTLIWGYGKWRIISIEKLVSDALKVPIAIVQGNIDQTIKWDPAFQVSTTQKYMDLSVSAKSDKPELIVFPETATPFYFEYNFRLTEMVKEGIRNTESNFLIGSPSFIRRENEKIEYYNSAYLLNAQGEIIGKYDKTHLVPFGEYIPLKKWLPFLGKIVEHVGDFETGKKGNILIIPNNFLKKKKDSGLNLGIQICYEIIFPPLSRMMVKNEAMLLVNITNDAWYGRTSAPYQHFSMAVFRAVENRRSLIRSANTGISGFISPAGNVIDSTPLFEDAVMTRYVPVIQEKTFYTKFGDVFAMGCLMISLVFIFRCMVKK